MWMPTAPPSAHRPPRLRRAPGHHPRCAGRRGLLGWCRVDRVSAVHHRVGPDTLINVRVAASGLKIVEMCGYESDRVHGVSNLKPVTDELRAVRTIRQEFSSERAARKLLRSGVANPCAPVITARRTARSGDSVVSRAHMEIISNTAITRGSQVVVCEQEVTA